MKITSYLGGCTKEMIARAPPLLPLSYPPSLLSWPHTCCIYPLTPHYLTGAPAANRQRCDCPAHDDGDCLNDFPLSRHCCLHPFPSENRARAPDSPPRPRLTSLSASLAGCSSPPSPLLAECDNSSPKRVLQSLNAFFPPTLSDLVESHPLCITSKLVSFTHQRAQRCDR